LTGLWLHAPVGAIRNDDDDDDEFDKIAIRTYRSGNGQRKNSSRSGRSQGKLTILKKS